MHDVYNGYGHIKYANGNIYQGDFLEGKKDGDGILREMNGTIYEGNFDRDEK